MEQKLSVIIPLLNEEGNVLSLYNRLKDTLGKLALPWEIIFIDDGSTDDTRKILEDLETCDDRVRIIRFCKNFGQSAALSAGFDIASGDIAITIDGDLQCNPEDMALLLEPMRKGADIVCGWRQANGIQMLLKRTPSLAGNALGPLLFGLKIHDFSCPFKAYRRSFFEKLSLADGMHRFIPIFAKFEGMNIGEVKIPYFPRRNGRSKYSFLRFPKILRDIISLKTYELFPEKDRKDIYLRAK